MAKAVHADQRYIIGLLENDGPVIKEIYERCARKVCSFILFNNGNQDDAADVFQEGLVDVYQQAKYKSLVLTCPFEPFLLLICKRKWFNQLKKRSALPVTNDENDLLDISEDTFMLAEYMEEEEQKMQLFLQVFEKLGERCKEIIRWSMKGEAQEKGAELMGVTYGYLRKKKSECIASLIQRIHANKNLI